MRHAAFVTLLALGTSGAAIAQCADGSPPPCRTPVAARTLDIYFIDVEGGAATLIVTPTGQSVLFDAGWGRADSRDLTRTRAAMKAAGINHIDYLILSHFHADHAGGVAPLAKAVEIGAFYDHGESVEKGSANTSQNYSDYLAAAGSHRHVAQPGEKIALNGVDLTFVVAHAQVIAKGLGAADPNALCASYSAHATDTTENAQSLGFVLRSGTFSFAAVGDLSWNSQYPLACPVNLLGKIDLVEAPHHASREDFLPMLWSATNPLAVVVNNGSRKGGDTAAMGAIRHLAGPNMWSLHRKLASDSAHNALEQLTANLADTTDCPGAWIRARVNADGSFTLTNGRNQYSRTYPVRR